MAEKFSRADSLNSMSMPRQLQRDEHAVDQSQHDQANAGEMLHAQERPLAQPALTTRRHVAQRKKPQVRAQRDAGNERRFGGDGVLHPLRSEEHTSELQSL